jgi:hypothetical protein
MDTAVTHRRIYRNEQVILEWDRSWHGVLEVTRDGEGDVTGMVRMGWNTVTWKYKRLIRVDNPA